MGRDTQPGSGLSLPLSPQTQFSVLPLCPGGNQANTGKVLGEPSAPISPTQRMGAEGTGQGWGVRPGKRYSQFPAWGD